MSSSLSVMPAIPQYLTIVRNEAASVSRYEQTVPADQHEVAAFRATAPTIDSAKALLVNYKALKVVLGANGLSSLMGQTAVVRDLLTQDPDAPTSLARKSGNAKWLSFAKSFASWSPSPLGSAEAIAQISQKYMTNQFETAKQAETPGVGNALYFTRTMSNVSSVSQIMADPKLLNVVETVSGFDSTQFGALDYDEQVRLLTPKINMKDFSSPAGIQRYAQRYLAMLQVNPQPTSTPATTLSLYGASGGSAGILSLFGQSGGASSASLFSMLT